MKDILLPEFAQGKRRLRPTANVEIEIVTRTTVAASVRGKKRKNVDHYKSTNSHGLW
jgi:hypothetical protein